MDAKEYLKTANPFKFKDFFLYAMGYRHYREASKFFGVSTLVIGHIRSGDPYMPSLRTCKSIAKACGVDGRELWLKACGELYDSCDSFKLQK